MRKVQDMKTVTRYLLNEEDVKIAIRNYIESEANESIDDDTDVKLFFNSNGTFSAEIEVESDTDE